LKRREGERERGRGERVKTNAIIIGKKTRSECYKTFLKYMHDFTFKSE